MSRDRASTWRDGATFEGPSPPVDAGTSRREFLSRMSACLALAGLGGSCSEREPDRIVPYVDTPVGITPGRPLRYATALTLADLCVGVLVETREGRPIRIDGNPTHPSSLGAVDARTQAELLELYDPARARPVRVAGEASTFADCARAIADALEPLRAAGGAGLRLLTGTVTSPTLGATLGRVLEAFPEARWHRWDAAHRDAARRGMRMAWGADDDLVWDMGEAHTLLVLDGDPMDGVPGHLAHARAITAAHGERDGRGPASRLYAAEGSPTLFGALADHRLAVRPSRIGAILARVARTLGVAATGGAASDALTRAETRFADAVARDLEREAPHACVWVGDRQPAAVHALAHATNDRLGAFGTVVHAIDPIEESPVLHGDSIAELAHAIEAGEVEMLLVLDGNPVHTAPAPLGLGDLVATVPFSLHLGLRDDETAAACRWQVPRAHELECWGDARAHDGTVTIQQPVIRTLFDGRTPLDLCAVLLGEEGTTPRDLVARRWRNRLGGTDDPRWEEALRRGVIAGTRHSRRTPGRIRASEPLPDPPEGLLELEVRLHPSVWDGRFANNPWLLELPEPFTKLTWGNAALLAPATAERLGLTDGDEVELHALDASAPVSAPISVLPGQPADLVTVHLGFGRARDPRARGFDPLPLAHAAPTTLALRATGARRPLVRTQQHGTMEDRAPVVVADRERLRSDPDSIAADAHHSNPTVSLAGNDLPQSRHQWGMAIDLSSCIGCNACVIACQSENNVPTVGPEQVAIGREMHWIRVDRYFDGDAEEPRVQFQPLACVHCENAPCEYVCPVGATVHSADGLNQMVYNRCIGTRYCSNNCPYKVRRFNFLAYADAEPAAREPSRNPDVTVRTRGVMEKCTYCIQRIDAAGIEAKLADRPLRDGDVVTACQSACPTRAIAFGDVADPGSEVSARKRRAGDYPLLGHLNTRPRTSYGPVIRNPNPELEP